MPVARGSHMNDLRLDGCGRSKGSRRRVRCVALGVLAVLCLVGLLPRSSGAKEPRGWFYVHKYLSDQQRKHYGGIGTAPVFVFRDSGALVRSGQPDGSQPLGTLVAVPAGTYYVAAGRFNIGLTRQRYTVKPNKVTVIQTGFVGVETWPEADQPREGCSPWDAEMTLYGQKGEEWVPIFSNSRREYNTRHFGLVQMLAGSYRVRWHGFETDVVIKPGTIYRMALGTVGPLRDPKGRVSKSREEGASNPGVRLCDGGPTHLLAGRYWVSYVKPKDEYPYEERNWQQVDVPPLNEPGYDKQLPGERIGHAVLRGAAAAPVAAPVEDMKAFRAAAKPSPAGGNEDDPLGGDINWEAPP